MTDKEILKIYMEGFNDELTGDLRIIPNNELSKKAYNLGRIDALMGDELSSIDLQTNQQILKRIRNDK